MKRGFIYLWLGSLLAGALPPVALGQAADNKLLFGGMNALVGVGRYNSVTYGVGFSGRYHHPLTQNVALTAKAGLEVYRMTFAYILPVSYNGFGYNLITGYGFNTIYYNYYGYEYEGTGISVPVCFGPRVYLTSRVHADLNVGVDIAANRNVVSVLRVEPSMGFTHRLPNGGFLDLNAGYFTSIARGSGAFTVGAAYGFTLNR